MDLETIIYERRGPVAIVTLNRPEHMNAISRQLRADLIRCWEDFAGDDSLKVAILTGAGRAFCAGADLKERADPFGEGNPDRWDPKSRGWPSGLGITKPIIAAVNGVVVGGGHALLLDCDIRIASTEARFGDIQVRHGIIGAVDHLMRAYPPAVALYLGMSGELISAQLAYQWGFVSHLVEPDQLMPTSIALAEKIAGLPQDAVAAYKRMATELVGLTAAEANERVEEVAANLVAVRRARSARREA